MLRMKKPRIIYHRLNTRQQLETTSFESFDGIECDLRMTKDGIVILHHDRRVQNGDSRYYWVDKLTLPELIEIVGNVFTFEELLKGLLKKMTQTQFSELLLDLDLKQSGMEKHIAVLLKKYAVKNVMICSPDIWTLKSFEDIYPDAILGLTYSPEDKWDLWDNRTIRYFSLLFYYSLKPFLFRLIRRKTKTGDIEVASIHHRLINKKVVEFLRQYTIHIDAWGTDNEKRLRELIELGVDGIKTKRPDLLKKILNTKLEVPNNV
jgi:glycerophosphoryl diester phosphodiesterase